ncbi:MAG: OmpH family outer membrane protein [Pirellulaceae bacterium]
MKSQFLKLVAFSIALVVSANQLFGQEGGIVAVLDVAKVFKENLEFSNQMDAIRAEADLLKKNIETKQEEIRSRASTLSGMDPARRKQFEAQLEQDQTALRTEARQTEQDLLVREASIYFATYTKMQRIVKEISQQNNIALVLRFDSAPINPDNPNEVVVGVNRAIVYQYKLDLTTMVISNMGPTVAAKAGETKLK